MSHNYAVRLLYRNVQALQVTSLSNLILIVPFKQSACCADIAKVIFVQHRHKLTWHSVSKESLHSIIIYIVNRSFDFTRVNFNSHNNWSHVFVRQFKWINRKIVCFVAFNDSLVCLLLLCNMPLCTMYIYFILYIKYYYKIQLIEGVMVTSLISLHHTTQNIIIKHTLSSHRHSNFMFHNISPF